MCLFPHVSEGNLVEVVCSIDSTSSYCTAGQITDRYFSLSQLIYTSGLKKQSKENEDFTKLVCSVGKLVDHKRLEKLRSLALELQIILHSFVHCRMHIFIPETILISYIVIVLPSYMSLKIRDHIYNSPFLYVVLSSMNIIYILTILLRHLKKIISILYLGLESGLSVQISD